MRPIRALFVSAEVYPFAKTGGLADVSAGLPAGLRDRGIDVHLLLPGYPQALERAPSPREVLELGDPLGCGEARLLETHLSNSRIPVWLIDCPDLYDRVGGLYGNEDGCDWADNHLRFALLSHVAAGIASEPGARWQPDIVHANDWHTGLVPLLLAAQGQWRPPTLLTIHNLAYQGLFDSEQFARLGLPTGAYRDMEFYGRISFLKAGIRAADAITTVSPTYAREILTPECGCGLDGLLRERASRLVGILNGVDYGIWDPSCDPYLACNYTARSSATKALNKEALQIELGLEVEPDRPLLAFMSRLVHQKTPDLVLEALPALIEDGMQFALVAEGESVFEDLFRQVAASHPGRVAVEIGYNEILAHRLLAGADMLLHPSRFEPCGLVPIYAMRYGTIPVVCRSGGMADSVTDASSEAIRRDTATGICLGTLSVQGLVEGVRRGHALFRQPIVWRKIQRCAMRQDFGWRHSVDAYLNLYRSLLGVTDASEAQDKMPETLSAQGL